MRKCFSNLFRLTALTLVFLGINSQAAVLLEDDFSGGIIIKEFRVYEHRIDDGWLKMFLGPSDWTIGDGVVANSSTNVPTGYPSNGPAEAPLCQMFGGIASSDRSLRFSFDYSVAAGDKLYVHLWGYTGTVVTPSGELSNIEAGSNGNVHNGEASSGSGLNAFNLKDGATTGFGGAGTAISGELTGSGTFSTLFNLNDLDIAGVESAGDLNYYLIGVAKDEDGTVGTTWVDNMSLETVPVKVIRYDDFSSGNVMTTWRIYESQIDMGWRKMTGNGAGDESAWTIGGGVVSNSSAVAATGYPLSTAAESPLFDMFSNTANSDTHLEFSVDYEVASGDTLYVHLWGYTGTAINVNNNLGNIEGAANGTVPNEEQNSPNLDAFNLKDGATTSFGVASTAISGPLTGSGTFKASIDINALGISGIENTGDFPYYLIGFAKDEDGNPGSTSVDNVSLVAAPVPIPQGTVIIVN